MAGRKAVRPYKEVNGQYYILSGGTRWKKAVLRNCELCKRPFCMEEAQMKYMLKQNNKGKSLTRGRFCSHSCNAKGQYADQGSPGRTAKQCVVCTRWFTMRRSKKDRYKTCGRAECRTEVSRRETLRRHKEGLFTKASLRSAGVGKASPPR